MTRNRFWGGECLASRGLFGLRSACRLPEGRLGYAWSDNGGGKAISDISLYSAGNGVSVPAPTPLAPITSHRKGRPGYRAGPLRFGTAANPGRANWRAQHVRHRRRGL